MASKYRTVHFWEIVNAVKFGTDFTFEVKKTYGDNEREEIFIPYYQLYWLLQGLFLASEYPSYIPEALVSSLRSKNAKVTDFIRHHKNFHILQQEDEDFYTSLELFRFSVLGIKPEKPTVHEVFITFLNSIFTRTSPYFFQFMEKDIKEVVREVVLKEKKIQYLNFREWFSFHLKPVFKRQDCFEIIVDSENSFLEIKVLNVNVWESIKIWFNEESERLFLLE